MPLTTGVHMAETEDDKKVWKEMIRLIKAGHLKSSAKRQAQRNLNIWRKPRGGISNMILKPIAWNPEPTNCFLCRKNGAEYHATIKINGAATITVSLCEQCSHIPEADILKKLRLK